MKNSLKLSPRCGFEPDRPLDPVDRRLVQARRSRHRPGRPLRGIDRLLLEGLDDHPLDILVGDLAGLTRARLVVSPSGPTRPKRPRQRPTVGGFTPNSPAISVLGRPSAAARTIRDRNARACDVFGRRAQRSMTSRSCSLGTKSTLRPVDRSIVVDNDDVCDPITTLMPTQVTRLERQSSVMLIAYSGQFSTAR